MARLIDKDAVLSFFRGRRKDLYSAETIMDIIGYSEEVDAIQVVRCAECKRSSGAQNDGTTRCPLEEHYALPDDGYCHLGE